MVLDSPKEPLKKEKRKGEKKTLEKYPLIIVPQAGLVQKDGDST